MVFLKILDIKKYTAILNTDSYSLVISLSISQNPTERIRQGHDIEGKFLKGRKTFTIKKTLKILYNKICISSLHCYTVRILQ